MQIQTFVTSLVYCIYTEGFGAYVPNHPLNTPEYVSNHIQPDKEKFEVDIKLK